MMYQVHPPDPNTPPLPDEMVVSPTLWFSVFMVMERASSLLEDTSFLYLEIPYDIYGKKDGLIIVDGRTGEQTKIYVIKRARNVIEYCDIGFCPEKNR